MRSVAPVKNATQAKRDTSHLLKVVGGKVTSVSSSKRANSPSKPTEYSQIPRKEGYYLFKNNGLTQPAEVLCRNGLYIYRLLGGTQSSALVTGQTLYGPLAPEQLTEGFKYLQSNNEVPTFNQDEALEQEIDDCYGEISKLEKELSLLKSKMSSVVDRDSFEALSKKNKSLQLELEMNKQRASVAEDEVEMQSKDINLLKDRIKQLTASSGSSISDAEVEALRKQNKELLEKLESNIESSESARFTKSEMDDLLSLESMLIATKALVRSSKGADILTDIISRMQGMLKKYS